MGDWAVSQQVFDYKRSGACAFALVTVALAGSSGGLSTGCHLKPVPDVLHGKKAGTGGLLEKKVKLLITVYIGNGQCLSLYKYMTCQWCVDVLLAFRKETIQHPGLK